MQLGVIIYELNEYSNKKYFLCGWMTKSHSQIDHIKRMRTLLRITFSGFYSNWKKTRFFCWQSWRQVQKVNGLSFNKILDRIDFDQNTFFRKFENIHSAMFFRMTYNSKSTCSYLCVVTKKSKTKIHLMINFICNALN